MWPLLIQPLALLAISIRRSLPICHRQLLFFNSSILVISQHRQQDKAQQTHQPHRHQERTKSFNRSYNKPYRTTFNNSKSNKVTDTHTMARHAQATVTRTTTDTRTTITTITATDMVTRMATVRRMDTRTTAFPATAIPINLFYSSSIYLFFYN